MADSTAIAKAELWELGADGQKVSGSRVVVQFNPETLKVSFANQIVPPANGGSTDQRGTAATQFVGKGTTKLSVQLWFDVTAELAQGQQNETDVRQLTKKVVYFITPKPSKKDPSKDVPPAVRFQWGTFQFDGIMESMEESLEFFSAEGKPLRASVTLSLSQQRIEFAFVKPEQTGATGAPGKSRPGTRSLTQAAAGQTLQGLASTQGQTGDWQAIASANGIENPRMLKAGQFIDMGLGKG
jgi:hypothetical protein